MWIDFSFAVGAVVAGLLLAFYLRSKVAEEGDAWQQPLLASNPLANDSASADSSQGRSASTVSLGGPQEVQVQSMNSFSGQTSQSPKGVELRRSSRIERSVPLLVLGTNRDGESFQESTAALSMNLHGCRYASRHDYPPEGWVTLQLTGTDGAARSVRARVRSVLLPRSPRELSQVGVELETPGNFWGIASPPADWARPLSANAIANNGEEWRRVLDAASSSAAPAVTPIAPVSDPSASLSSVLEKHLAHPEKRAEVTMFPSPVAPPEPQAPAANPAAPQKSQRIVLTSEQLLQGLQSRLQQAADRAIKTAVATQLDESVRTALSKIDDVWKANVRQTEELSTARLTEAQNRWERELVVYRGRAEEIARRMEALAASTNQSLVESHKLLQRLTTEIEPQLHARLDQSFMQAHSQLEAKAAELSERTLSKWSEGANLAVLDARTKLEESIAEAHSLRDGVPAGISEQQARSIVNAAREQTLNRQDERLAEIWRQFEQQQDQACRRTEQIAQQIEKLTNELHETQAQQEKALEQAQALASAPAAGGLPPQQLDSALDNVKKQFHDLLEWRLGEVSAHFQQLHDAVLPNTGEMNQRLEALASETRGSQTQHEQQISELRAQFSSVPAGITQERLDWLLNSAREQILNHIEWRVGEASAEFEERHEAARRRSEEIAQNFEQFAVEIRARLDENKALAGHTSHELLKADAGTIEHSVDRASRDFETAAARISDRHLIQLMEQKQAMTGEAALELEARASEVRALVQKSANATLEEFRRRVEVQVDLIIAEATERITSTLASIDAENRATCEARRRSLESEVARAAEQSTMEFRSGIRAFLYSCLVAAVGAVDQHAQTTLAGISKDPNAASLTLGAPEIPSPQQEERSSAASASSSSPNSNNL
jgi:hypothetical protein